MFKVQNADFIADKLAAELLPDQEFREVLKNALEAVDRRMSAQPSGRGGRIAFDVDWTMHERSGRWFVSCADNGDGMTRSELDKYTTTLAVVGAGQNQSIRGNQGMGLKISGPTRHKKGVLIRSLKSGERTAVQIGWDGAEYGLIPIGPNDEVVMPMPSAAFPAFINNEGAGTVVTFLGSTDDDNTFVPAGRPRGWLFKYLNTRFFRLSHNGVEVLVRVPVGDEDEWPTTASEAEKRMRREGGRSFNLTVVRGTAEVWDKAADKQGDGFRDVVAVPGDPAAGIPEATVHWWVLPTGEGSDVSSRTHSGGSFAVLFQNELHDWKTGNLANPFFARLGVLFGKSRICFILEPKGTTVSSDFARAHVLVNGLRVLDSECWLRWAEQFKLAIPERVRETMAEEQARLQVEDPDRVRRIRERLQEVMQLLRPRRFRAAQQGRVNAGGPLVTGAGHGPGEILESQNSGKARAARRPRSRGIGAVLSEIEDQGGTMSVELLLSESLEPRWVSEEESDGFTIVKGNGNGLHDRAAALAGTDGRSANILLLNREFRGYQAMVAAISDWANPEGDDDKLLKIEALTQEWIEQKMIESVEGLRQLENGKTWITEHYDEAMSPVALTAAFMADRYHTLREVKRAVGAFRPMAVAKQK